MVVQKVCILEQLSERLKNSPEKDQINRGLVYGLHYGYGGINYPVALSVINYEDGESLKLAQHSLPFGLTLIGIVEFEGDADQDAYSALDSLDNPILFKVTENTIIATQGLDFLTPVELNVISNDYFWEKTVCTFRIRGKFLLSSILEFPDLKDCFALAKARIINQAAYVLGRHEYATILPRNGNLISEDSKLKKKHGLKVEELYNTMVLDSEEYKKSNMLYFNQNMSIIEVQILDDMTKCGSFQKSPVLISDKTPRCKLFEHYLDIDTLCIVPMTMDTQHLYRKFNASVCAQLEGGFHQNIISQLGNSISANKPEVFHFWPHFAQHFITFLYPQNTLEEKLLEKRLAIHNLFIINETRPYFRRSSAIFQEYHALISPHLTLKGKYPETEVVKGHFEYRHYLQDSFNDNGWGCAYRSLQTIISWFRMQGFTECLVPTHKEIQECLVSLGDKPSSFIDSKQWIGSTEVGFVLEALLGISCRIINLSSGADLASRVTELQSHFRVYGTPIMIGGGVLAHTIIGASVDPENDDNVQYLILDPHYTGKDELGTILKKGWVGWKDSNFWSKKDFYNLCLPLLPSAI